MSLSSAGLYAPYLLLAILVGLNTVPHPPGRAFLDSSPTAFTAARGWPVAAVARANDEGAFEIDASVVQGNTRYVSDAFRGYYAHLAWNWVFLAFDLAVAVSLATIIWVLSRKFTRGKSSHGIVT